MMAVESLLLTSSSLLILLLQLLLFQTSLAKPHNCTPSACGIFPNISYPFSLKGDPKHCGDFELACENNVTSFYLNSHKLYIKEINASYYPYEAIMRVVDASINKDICSFPTSSIYEWDFEFSFEYWPINYMSCPHPLKNSSGFTDTTPCQTPNSSRFTYIKVGHMNVSEVPETCRVDVVTRTSWRGFNDFKNALLGEEISSSIWYEFNDFKNASLEEINSALLYGFEINMYLGFEISKWVVIARKLLDFLGEVRLPFLIFLPIAVVSGAAISPVMVIIGFIAALGFILSAYSQHFQIGILWGGRFDPLYVYTARKVAARKVAARNCEVEPELLRVRNDEVEPELLRVRNDEVEPELQFKGPVTRLRAKKLQGYLQVLIRKQFEDLEDARCSHALVNLLTNEDQVCTMEITSSHHAARS